MATINRVTVWCDNEAYETIVNVLDGVVETEWLDFEDDGNDN